MPCARVRRIYELSSEQSRIVLIILMVLISTVSPVGYHMVILNVPEKLIQTALKEEIADDFNVDLADGSLKLLWSFIVAAQSVGALVGCLLLIPLEKAMGVKNTLLIFNNGVLFVSSLCLFVAYYWETTLLLLFGRLLIGIYTGLGTALLPIYIQELAPTKIKGALSCLIHIAVLFGAAAAGLLSLNVFLGRRSTWHILLALPALCCIVQTTFARFLPHTPGFYLSKGQSLKAADSIRYYYKIYASDDADAYSQLVAKYPDQWSFSSAMKSRRTRRALGLGMIISGAQIFTGAMATVSYSTSMFESVSIFSSLVSLFPTLGSVFSILLSLPALRLVESCGRKRLMITTLIACATANYVLCGVSVITQYIMNLGIVGTIAIFLSFLLLGVGYNLGVGPLGFFLPGELVDVHYDGRHPSFLKKTLPETKDGGGSNSSSLVLSCNAYTPEEEEEESAAVYGTFD
ncbi:Solute carrier family 2, facilitated glucose transporter member 7 [Aphelenchoides fujianensis]|nr:Solute carrier family 2, facilitated glucose transporter member 7 [Aphelenchoides fujianensis]